jgi:hypothetical protein
MHMGERGERHHHDVGHSVLLGWLGSYRWFPSLIAFFSFSLGQIPLVGINDLYDPITPAVTVLAVDLIHYILISSPSV